MPAAKPRIHAEISSEAMLPVQEVGPEHEPVASPAHDLQKALQEASFTGQGFRERPMSNVMLVLTLVCVYAVAMLMMLGSISA